MRPGQYSCGPIYAANRSAQPRHSPAQPISDSRELRGGLEYRMVTQIWGADSLVPSLVHRAVRPLVLDAPAVCGRHQADPRGVELGAAGAAGGRGPRCRPYRARTTEPATLSAQVWRRG